jgi:hypothetical protein
VHDQAKFDSAYYAGISIICIDLWFWFKHNIDTYKLL